ncbi:MAG: SO2930 family diheme c-type cytochrome [Kofleriaceae bacterium]|nr:SO2930 family diheme c-type cytochrome [Kofleriaceae bacterium]
MRTRLALVVLAVAACGGAEDGGVDLTRPVQVDVSSTMPDRLSSLNLFTWDPETAAYTYNDEVIPYDINTPLFSDYALKDRAIYVPPGAEPAAYDPVHAFNFPVGSVVMKSFAFPADFRAPTENVALVETRLLVHFEDGWQAFPYIWNENQTDAVLSPAGEVRSISFVDDSGATTTSSYLIPQKNQCGNCHNRKPDLASTPVMGLIGPSARQLQRNGQLEQLAAANFITGLPALDAITPTTDFRPIEAGGLAAIASGQLDRAARDYLDANCAHCHNPNGVQGISSQLFLNHDNTDLQRLGVCKQPGSAGAGTGGLKYDIVPANAASSVLYFRVKTTEPGAMMPLIGRSLEHHRGSELVKAWIDAMPPTDPPNCGQ